MSTPGAEEGSGLVGSIGGVAVFLAFMLLAVQLLADLYATSVLTSAAHDAASTVAGAASNPGDPATQLAARAEAEARLRQSLGASGDEAVVDWAASDADEVVLTASIPSPSVLPGALRGGNGDDRIERTVHVRRVEVALSVAAGGVEAIPFGLLVFVAGSLLAANVWGVVDARLAATAAAREAARGYVEAPDPAVASEAASQAARDAIAGHGRDPDRLRLEVVHEHGQAWGRCVRVTAVARYSVPAATIPWIGGWGDATEVASSHSELVDPHRAGIPGAVSCG